MSVSLPTGKPYSRLGDFPLDASSVFETKTEAEQYAQNNPTAYHTQIIGVTEDDMAYMIAVDKSLVPMIGEGGEINLEDLISGNITLDEEIKLLGTSLGSLDDGDTIPEGTTLTALVKMLAQKRLAATYTAPSVSLSGSGTKTVESGTSIATTLVSTFNQNDAGAVTSYSVQKNGTDVHTDTSVSEYSPPATVIGDESWTFKSSVGYAAGSVKNDNMGDPSPNGAIEAGSVNSGNVIFRGKRNTFYASDTTATAANSSNEIRSFAGTILGQSDGDRITINVPAGSRRITIAYPATLGELSSVKYVEQGNAEYSDLFIESEVNVKGADGYTAVAYKVYTWITAVPTSAAMTLNVTI